jgi:predicted Kef-type K+ transport protein
MFQKSFLLLLRLIIVTIFSYLAYYQVIWNFGYPAVHFLTQCSYTLVSIKKFGLSVLIFPRSFKF